eukprot:2937550-Rhodomonas_salina.2
MEQILEDAEELLGALLYRLRAPGHNKQPDLTIQVGALSHYAVYGTTPPKLHTGWLPEKKNQAVKARAIVCLPPPVRGAHSHSQSSGVCFGDSQWLCDAKPDEESLLLTACAHEDGVGSSVSDKFAPECLQQLALHESVIDMCADNQTQVCIYSSSFTHPD